MTALEGARALAAEGRLDEALAVSEPLARAVEADHEALALHATLLKAAGRPDEALVFHHRAVQRFPDSGVAWHNLASTLVDLGRGAEAEAAVQRAFARGLEGAETWRVRGRALLALGDPDAAEKAYAEAINKAPQDVDIAAELAELIWMWRGDAGQAQGLLDAVFRAGGAPSPLLLAKARLLEATGEPEAAADLLAQAAERMPDNLSVQLAAAQAAVQVERSHRALAFGLQAEAIAPRHPRVLNALCIIRLARGDADAALAKARLGLEVAPDDQSLLGWAATAARAVRDPLHEHLFDYDAFVGVYELDAPPGWETRQAFLSDLATSLGALHPYRQPPTNQSLRLGSQTQHTLTGSDDPALKAFFQALDKPLREHMAKLGTGADPHRRRNTGRYRLRGAWSVLLKPGGFHADHFHPEGWISSAFYVETPEAALARPGREGWLRFGQPPFPTVPPMKAERHIRPAPGRLVLFPSYMWHGTVPFTTNETRMTLAFDAVPA